MEKKKLDEYMDLSNAMYVLAIDKLPVTSEGVLMASYAIKALVEEVRRLEALVPAKPKLGEKVEVFAQGPYKGRVGTVINVEPFAQRFPYSVELHATETRGAVIEYFREGDLRKAVV